jgi:hypothetical protein
VNTIAASASAAASGTGTQKPYSPVDFTEKVQALHACKYLYSSFSIALY